MYIDLLVKAKNAEQAGKKSFRVQYSKMDHTVADQLVRFGFFKKAEIKGKAPKRTLEVVCNPERPIRGVRFVSRPSLRRYVKHTALRPVKGGAGIAVISTSRGVMSGVQAKKEKIGGQVLFEIW